MIKTSIVGGTGYMGFELLRWLLRHPEVEIARVTSRGQAGVPVSQLHPALLGCTDLRYVDELPRPGENDIVFVATPHGASMEVIPGMISSGCRVIDLSGDYRLSSAEEYRLWYGKEHTDPDNLDRAVYGLTELNRSRIASAQLVANPGCYPTGALLALLPAASSGSIAGDVIIDSKSGTSGAGAGPGAFTHHPSCANNVSPYNVGKHRHTPEIEGNLRELSAGVREVSFTPHLVPIVRGIETSCYFRLAGDVSFDHLLEQYGEFERENRFVNLVEEPPRISSVLGSNRCQICVKRSTANIVAVFSAIDNLCKGGSGQAIQNMNVMFGLDETTGIEQPGLGV